MNLPLLASPFQPVPVDEMTPAGNILGMIFGIAVLVFVSYGIVAFFRWLWRRTSPSLKKILANPYLRSGLAFALVGAAVGFTVDSIPRISFVFGMVDMTPYLVLIGFTFGAACERLVSSALSRRADPGPTASG